MTRTDKKKSSARCRRASECYRKLRSERVQGKTGGPKNSSRFGR